jgi:hypothetical protein
MSDDFPAELRAFIAQHIESLAQLEALLRLRKDREQSWDAAALAREIYITEDMAAGIVADLERRGFVQRVPDPPAYRYDPANAEFDRLLDQLATLYQQRRVAVITEIYSNPTKKVQTFADAFRLRRDQ